jgi:signal transduction histidine kinase
MGLGRLPTDLETAVYRVVQEALTNATRHGRPTEVFVALARGGQSVSGYIEDDGLGFDTQVPRRAEAGRGLGLVGMRERLAAFGGTLTITSAPGRGTAVRFDVPLEILHGDYCPAC